ARHDIVCLNAGAALVASGRVTSLANGVARARELIASGAARHRLETLIRVSQALA
ncbi:MAG: anthranilate phosphoribosyltransferase, partial [Proteobacteria bacterium]|nr:anthranilate phosphoribosyltransferase [Pseudomonadota bacterium]